MGLYLQLFGLAFFTSLAVTGFMVIAGLGDVAKARSSHKDVIPTGAGIGFVAALGVVMIILNVTPMIAELPRNFPILLSLIFAVAMIGILDDILTLPARLKFVILLCLCALTISINGPITHWPHNLDAIALPYSFAVGGSILWLFVVVNSVNFMDGANGLMGLYMMIASLALFCASLVYDASATAILTLANAGFLCGFLPYNLRRKALIFSGDVGALLSGFIFALSVIMLIRESENARLIYVGPLLLLPFLTDVLLTLIWRLRLGDNILEAHNMHLYQRLIRYGLPNIFVTGLYGLSGLILAAIVLLSIYYDFIGSVNILLTCVIVLSGVYYWLARRLPN